MPCPCSIAAHRGQGKVLGECIDPAVTDERDPRGLGPETALGLDPEQCSLTVIRGAHYKYVHFAALPPLFFDLKADPQQLVNRAADPAYAARMGQYAAKMLDWRLGYADRTLTGYRATPNGLEVRAA